MVDKDKGDLRIIHFLPWGDFPKLKELELDPQWSVHFEPLPLHHPLQKLNVQLASFDALPSLLDGIDMRRLTLQRARWVATGELVGRTKTMKIDAEQSGQLWEMAKAKSIRFEVIRGSGRVLNRDDVLGITTSQVMLASLFDQI